MTIAQIENLIRYVTNSEGKTTDVLVPLELWQQLIHSLNTDNISGLAWIDEQEPKEQILVDLQESIRKHLRKYKYLLVSAGFLPLGYSLKAVLAI